MPIAVLARSADIEDLEFSGLPDPIAQLIDGYLFDRRGFPAGLIPGVNTAVEVAAYGLDLECAP